MRSSCPSSIRLWPARRNQTLTMKPLRPQFPVILVIYCFCMLQIPSSGFPQPLADPPDGLDIVQLEFPPVHPLMHLAAKLATRRMKRFLQRGSGTAAVDFTKKDHAATWGRPFFLFR
ncbi:hypothetical protein H8959_013643, partial [Pygathrix nigripes]